MINTIGGTVVIVSDQQKAIEFYTQKLGFELKTDMFFGSSNSSNSSGIRWVEVAPKKSQSTISLMVANAQLLSNEGEMEAAKERYWNRNWHMVLFRRYTVNLWRT